MKLSSNLGACYYPAGHIWHYIPAYWLHLQTERAEDIVKFGHLIIHSLTNYFIYKIAVLYFKNGKDDRSADSQLIAFLMLANKETRSYYATMYNDELMALYMIVAIYLVLKNKPIWASVFVTLAMSIKAGVLLLLPGFLG